MAFWCVREELSQFDRMRRSYYELLRDDLDQFMLQYSLTDSYNNFCARKIPYPFVEKRELKPRARIPDLEYECQNAFLVIFVEDKIPEKDKKYIRFFDVNKTTKKNLLHSKTIPFADKFDRSQKCLESVHFYDFLRMLLPVDYALLIQRQPLKTKANSYLLSHYHVRIDWPITDAAEDLARNLRYVSKDIYEKGDRCAEDIQKKFFEYYGLPTMVGGRRTAAIVAAQYLKQIPCITTIYAGSSESRALIRISERGVSKAILMKFTNAEIEVITSALNITPLNFKKHYTVGRAGKSYLGIFQATYAFTSHAVPPEDGKLRDIKPDLNWLSVGGQHILPKPGEKVYPPLSHNIIYS